jgi:hypothetical protein
MREIFRRKHILWLKMLFTSFALPRSKEADMLEDFAKIELRHLKWIAKEYKEFDWSREDIKLHFNESKKAYEIIEDELMALELLYNDTPLFKRIKSDERYMLFCLNRFENYKIEAFNKGLEYKNLDSSSLKALIEFLFEETYKEYELVITYFYSKMKIDSADIKDVFEDLIEESIYHLKSFALLQSKLGLLQIPRAVMKEVYQFDDLKKFIQDSIEEEIAAKEQCKMLSSSIKDEELSLFFDFINNQEDFHIELMREVLKKL